MSRRQSSADSDSALLVCAFLIVMLFIATCGPK